MRNHSHFPPPLRLTLHAWHVLHSDRVRTLKKSSALFIVLQPGHRKTASLPQDRGPSDMGGSAIPRRIYEVPFLLVPMSLYRIVSPVSTFLLLLRKERSLALLIGKCVLYERLDLSSCSV